MMPDSEVEDLAQAQATKPQPIPFARSRGLVGIALATVEHAKR